MLAALAATKAAHLLLPLSRAPGGPAAYLPASPRGSCTALGGRISANTAYNDGDSASTVAVACEDPVPGHQPPPGVLELLTALLTDGELDATSAAPGGAPRSATAVSAAAAREPGMLTDMALQHVLTPLLQPPSAGDAPVPVLGT